MLNIIRRQVERNAIFLLAIMAVLAVLEFVICAIVASVDFEKAYDQMLPLAPPLIRAMIEQNLMGGSPAGVLAFGWNHPVVHALLATVAIALPARAIAGEVEGGTIELVLAQPISRAAYFAAHVLFGACALSAVLVGGLLGTAMGKAMFSVGEFTAARMAALFLNGLLLQLAIYALTLLASSFGREAGRVAMAGVLVAVISYFVNAVGTLWDKAAFLKPYALQHYYDPRALLVDGELSTRAVSVLAAIGAVAIGAAFVQFNRRDLP